MDGRKNFAFRGYPGDAEYEGSKPPAALITGLERVCMSLDNNLKQAEQTTMEMIAQPTWAKWIVARSQVGQF